MNKKALALIIGGLILVAAIVYVIFIYDFSGTDDKTGETPGQSQTAEPVISKSAPLQVGTEVMSAEEQSRDAAEKLAIYFADRYGSSSNQADFSNLTDLEVFMTDSLKEKTQSFVAAERAKAEGSPEYEGVTTKAVVVEFVTFSEITGSAEGIVKTRRQKTLANGEVTASNQDLSIGLKKQNGTWKVDRADWK